MLKDDAAVFEPGGDLSRRELWLLALGSPFFLTILIVEVVRIWRAMQGEPLLITGLAGFDVTVQWAVSPVHFMLGMVLHAVIIVFVAVALWFQLQQWRTWLRAKRN